MDRKDWNVPATPNELRLNASEGRLYIDICKDLFSTFEALKKTLDEWETTRDSGKVFVQEACKIPALINEMEQVTRNKRFAMQVTHQIYHIVFCGDRPVHASFPPSNHQAI